MTGPDSVGEARVTPSAANVPLNWPGSDWEGRCSGELCWYTLPVVDGLIVAHSKAGTLDVCEGGGRAPLAPAPTVSDNAGLPEELAGDHWPMCCRCHVCEGYPDRCDCGQRQRVVQIAALLAERDEYARQVTAVRELAREYRAIAARRDLTDDHQRTCRTTANRILRALGDPT